MTIPQATGADTPRKVMEALSRLGELAARFDPRDPEGLARTFRKALSRSLENDRRIRPGFSQSWVVPEPPEDAEKLLEYGLGEGKVVLYRIKGETEALYHLVPFEYSLPAEQVRLIDDARERLLECVPDSPHALRPERARRAVALQGTRVMLELARERGLSLGPSRELQLPRAERLAQVLARYTAGLGVVENLLSDPRVNDIYIDAPAQANPVHVTLGGLSDARAGGRCRTNIWLGGGDAESLLARLRCSSGRPFSEARPFLETDLPGFSARATVLGRPLSPEGLAVAIRRHSTEPWTLPRLIDAGSLTPLAAGLLSFLVDGQSAVLVAGGRGAGKTSLAGALMLELPRSMRVLTIEDTLELPSAAMQELGYKVQSLLVRSSLGGMGELSADDALRLSLRLGDSAIVMGEVRGQEARTLYEAMRAGTAGSSVLGTIHGSSAAAVRERVVNDLGISSRAFSATDIIVVAGLRRPHGSQRPLRRVTEITEVVKGSDGELRALMVYDEKQDCLVEAEGLRMSQKLGDIARSWGMGPEEALGSVRLRARVREELVGLARARLAPAFLGAGWVAASNDALWDILERRRGDLSSALEDWKAWFARASAREGTRGPPGGPGDA